VKNSQKINEKLTKTHSPDFLHPKLMESL